MDTRSINLSLGIIAMTCGIGALYFLAPVLIPLVLAFVLAILVNSLVRFIGDRWRAAPRWAVLVLAALVVTLGTAIAFVIYYELINGIGPARAALVSYLAPGVALFYGALLLDEAITAAAIAGLVLILGGVAIASRPKRAPAAVPAPAPARA